jgi:hypothetical protein
MASTKVRKMAGADSAVQLEYYDWYTDEPNDYETQK